MQRWLAGGAGPLDAPTIWALPLLVEIKSCDGNKRRSSETNAEKGADDRICVFGAAWVGCETCQAYLRIFRKRNVQCSFGG